MDGHHHHLPPHSGLESNYQNGYNTNDEYSNILSTGQDHDNFTNWAFDSHTNVASNPQSDPYLPWPQANAGLNNYDAHTYAKNPSNLHSNSYASYGAPHQFTTSSYDPSLVSSTTPSFAIGNPYGQQPVQHGTIAPQALEQERLNAPRPDQIVSHQNYVQNANLNTDPTSHSRTTARAPSVNQSAIRTAIPSGVVKAPKSFRVIDVDALSKATNSVQIRPFINLSQESYDFPINRATLPPVPRRKSRNELRALAKSDPKLQAKLNRPLNKAHHASRPTQLNRTSSNTSARDLSSSETETSDYDSSDESEEEDPLPPQRSKDPREAVKYDTIKALYASNRQDVGTERIRAGMIEYGEVVQSIKDRLKVQQKVLADAEESKKSAELPLLKSRVDNQLAILEMSLKTALQYGHRAILDQLGKHLKFVLSFNQLLIGQYKASDINGPLTRLLLEVLTFCTSLTDNTMADTKLQKTINVLHKAGNPEVQDLCKRIKANAAAATKEQATGEQQAKPVAINSPIVKSPPSSRPTPEPVAGVKRSAPGSAQSDQASKRVLTNSGVGSTSNGTSKAPSTVRRALPIVGSVKTANAIKPAPGAVKTKPAVPKPIPSATSANPTIKKAVTAKAPSVVAAAIKSIEKKATPVAPAKPAKPAFSFAETMANLNKPKEKEPTPKVEERQPPETPEARAKRLRKEERRKLRVTFKPDSQLVQVKLFHHDVDEELGHDASMIRDVGDVGGEGRMFKQHKDMMDVDEEDDAASEETLGEHYSPDLTDFSTVDLDERKRNYAPYGGGEMQPDSVERKAREQYEANTLMVFYTHPSDIPPCPREPLDPYNGEDNVTKSFGLPDPQGIFSTRAAKLGGASQLAQQQPQQPQQQTPLPNTTPDISAILAGLITPASAQQAPVPVSAPVHQAPAPNPAQDQMSEIQRILASISQAPPQQPVQPVQLPQSNIPTSLAGIFANLQPQNQNTSVPPQAQQQPAMPDANLANLASFFAQSNPGQNGMPGVGPMGNFGQFGFPGFSPPNAGQTQPQNQQPKQQQQQQQQQQSHQHYENEERRRWRERGDEDTSGRRNKGFKKSGGFVDKRFTVPCKYFAMGKCQKGPSCTYRHEQ